ncbi:hypothetical protein [Kitasatospora sp. NPDC093679]
MSGPDGRDHAQTDQLLDPGLRVRAENGYARTYGLEPAAIVTT